MTANTPNPNMATNMKGTVDLSVSELEQKLAVQESSFCTPWSKTELELREIIRLLEQKLANESDHFTRIQQFIYQQTETDVITDLHKQLKEAKAQNDLAVIELEWHRNNEKNMEKVLEMVQLECEERNSIIKLKNRELEAFHAMNKAMIHEKNVEIRELSEELKDRRITIEKLDKNIQAQNSSLNTTKCSCSETVAELRETIDQLDQKLAYKPDSFTRLQQFICQQAKINGIAEFHEQLKEAKSQNEQKTSELERQRNIQQDMEKKLQMAYRDFLKKQFNVVLYAFILYFFIIGCFY
uniref:Uncharacterized protein n=1 Tax=Caenorhabditis japonica TaxID=281687 RepID=A0A8R1E7B5_CAEJA